jgi:Fe2+ transport system protein FeoA
MSFTAKICYNEFKLITVLISEVTMQRLISLEKGQVGRITGMDLPPHTTKRLFELGLHTSAQVTMKKNNQGPCVLGIHHFTIAVSRKLCENIFVTLPGETTREVRV